MTIPVYAELDAVKDVLRDQLTAHDHEYILAIAAASRAIDNYCGRYFYQTAATAKLFAPRDPCLLWTNADIAVSTDLVIQSDTAGDGSFTTTWAASDYQLEPFDRLDGAHPYSRIRAIGTQRFLVSFRKAALTKVTAHWGFPSTPDVVHQATIMLACDIFKSKDVGSRTLPSPGPGYGGNAFSHAAGTTPLPALGAELEALLSPYCVVVVA